MARSLFQVARQAKQLFRKRSVPFQDRRTHLQIEPLEIRLVPTNWDMTQLAQSIGGYPHSGPTHLYLNFDGSNNISPYTDSQNPNLTFQEIQDTLFRTSEIYAPFNVEVSRLSGYGNIDQGNNGNTTILVGADASNYKNGVKFAYAHTNDDSVDYPGQQRGNWPNYGRDRAPNSDGHDVGFVDPVGANNSLWSPSKMSQSAAHEAGHTFGLAHVRTDGSTDPAALGAGTVSDIISYTDSNQYFANQTFPITTWNNTGTQTVLDPNEQPQWWRTKVLGVITEWDPVTTQNSFTYLQTVLGARPAETGYRVVHGGSLDSGARNQYFPPADTLGTGLDIGKNGSISRLGDYDVSRWTAPRDETLEVDVQSTWAKTLIPILLVYDGNGNLIQLQDVNNLKANLSVQSGKTYYFAVGAQDGNTLGNYHLEIHQETHDFFVTIDSINEHLHGTPQQNAAVTTQANVQIDGQDAEVSWDGVTYFTMQPLARTANEGNVKFHITVSRSAPWKSEFGTPVLQGGEWYVDFPDGSVEDTGFNSGEISDASQIPFGFKVKLTPAGPPGAKMGTVRTIDVTYDLASQTITGTADGNALSGKPGVPILSYGDGSTPDIAFTISMDTAAPVQKITWLASCLCNGLIHLFAIGGGAQGAVHKAQLPSGLYSDGTDDLGGSLLSLAAATNADGRTELFGIDAATHAVVHKWQTTPGGPFVTAWANDLGGSMIALTVGQNADGRLELFGIDAATHAVVHKWQTAPNGPFTSTWANDLGGTATALAVGKNADGRLELFAVDARTGAVVHKWQTAPGQPFTSAWASDLGGQVLQVAVGSNADGRLELFAIDARTRMVIHNRQLEPNSRFTPVWSNDLGGPVSAIAVGRGPDGLLDLFVTDLAKDQVVHKRQLQPNGPFALGWTDDLGDFSAPATQLGVGAEVSAPVAGTPFTITVVARGAHNDYATGYQGTVHFTSTDPLATLPADYTFTAADNGVHTFTIILRTAGAATVTLTDTARGSSICGGLSRVVFPAAATHLIVDPENWTAD